MNTPTPRTDKVVDNDMGDSGFIVDLIKHAQHLEQELNEAKAEKEDIIRALTTDGYEPKSGIAKTVFRYYDRLERQEKELIEYDRLKRVVDKYHTVIAEYSQLPHVLERKTK